MPSSLCTEQKTRVGVAKRVVRLGRLLHWLVLGSAVSRQGVHHGPQSLCDGAEERVVSQKSPVARRRLSVRMMAVRPSARQR